jgi:hypothetical protein
MATEINVFRKMVRTISNVSWPYVTSLRGFFTTKIELEHLNRGENGEHTVYNREIFDIPKFKAIILDPLFDFNVTIFRT